MIECLLPFIFWHQGLLLAWRYTSREISAVFAFEFANERSLWGNALFSLSLGRITQSYQCFLLFLAWILPTWFSLMICPVGHT